MMKYTLWPALTALVVLTAVGCGDDTKTIVELTVVEERDPWLRVRLANGRDAWLPESSIARVRAPAPSS